MTARPADESEDVADARERTARALLPVLALAGLPWVVLTGGGLRLVFAWGLVTPDPFHLVTLPDYLRYAGGTAALPRRLFAWPTSVLLFLAAFASAAAGVAGREDRRLTAGLLALAGASQLTFALGLTRGGVVGWPVGALALWTVALARIRPLLAERADP